MNEQEFKLKQEQAAQSLKQKARRIVNTIGTAGWKDIVDDINTRIDVLECHILANTMPTSIASVTTEKKDKYTSITIVSLVSNPALIEIKNLKDFMRMLKDYEKEL